MTLTADSGSTKTTWLLNNNNRTLRIHTQGINPFHQSEQTMHDIIRNELLSAEAFPDPAKVLEIHFYGAGCTKEKSVILRNILQEIFTEATTVEVASDMLGAAKALFANEEGIACILGTGANSCLYNGKSIVSNVSPMGYILGDEGSGAVIGKTFLNLLYKGGHEEMIPVFEKQMQMTLPDIIQHVYREPLPNRFLASIAPFIKEHIEEPWINDMVTECFSLFFRRNTAHYNRPDLHCSFVGSIAFYFEKQLREAAKKEGVLINKILKEPL